VAGRQLHAYRRRGFGQRPVDADHTQVEGRVNSVDLTQTPPVLVIGGQNCTINDIQQIIAPSQ